MTETNGPGEAGQAPTEGEGDRDDPLGDPPVAGVPGLGPVPAGADQPSADTGAAPAVQEVDGEPETAAGG